MRKPSFLFIVLIILCIGAILRSINFNSASVTNEKNQLAHTTTNTKLEVNTDNRYTRVAKKIRFAAEHGKANAQFFLGSLYDKEENLQHEIEQARILWQLSAEPNEISLMDLYYFVNEGAVPYDANQAVKWYRRAAEQGLSPAQTSLGKMYEQGDGVAQDYKQAVNWYRLAADQGDARAQYSLGLMYRKGNGVSQDINKARKWNHLAVEQGYAPAQYLLGNIYRNTEDIKAAKWYRLAAEQGHAWAQYFLGQLYTRGKGVEQDYDQALKWYHLAAEQGVAYAQLKLGNIYYPDHERRMPYNMFGTDLLAPPDPHPPRIFIGQSYQRAAKWYRLAADQGIAKAQSAIGYMYYEGKGVPKSYRLAAKWFRLSAEQGDVDSLYFLGIMYANGEGVQKSKVIAYALYNMVSSRNATGKPVLAASATEARESISESMSPEEIEAGQELSLEINRSKHLLKILDRYINKPAATIK